QEPAEEAVKQIRRRECRVESDQDVRPDVHQRHLNAKSGIGNPSAAMNTAQQIAAITVAVSRIIGGRASRLPNMATTVAVKAAATRPSLGRRNAKVPIAPRTQTVPRMAK